MNDREREALLDEVVVGQQAHENTVELGPVARRQEPEVPIVDREHGYPWPGVEGAQDRAVAAERDDQVERARSALFGQHHDVDVGAPEDLAQAIERVVAVRVSAKNADPLELEPMTVRRVCHRRHLARFSRRA